MDDRIRKPQISLNMFGVREKICQAKINIIAVRFLCSSLSDKIRVTLHSKLRMTPFLPNKSFRYS